MEKNEYKINLKIHRIKPTNYFQRARGSKRNKNNTIQNPTHKKTNPAHEKPTLLSQ